MDDARTLNATNMPKMLNLKKHRLFNKMVISLWYFVFLMVIYVFWFEMSSQENSFPALQFLIPTGRDIDISETK